LCASPPGVSQTLFQALSDKQRIGGWGALALKKISENKSDNKFSFSGVLLLPRDPDPRMNVRQNVLKAVVEIKRVTFVPVHILISRGISEPARVFPSMRDGLLIKRLPLLGFL
jgi:hypothetical protein